MSIAVRCSQCNSQFSAPAALAGRQVKCPKCGGSINVSADSAARQASATPAATSSAKGAASKPSSGVATKNPPQAKAPANAAGQKSPGEELLSGFRGKVEPAETTAAYKLYIVAVALLMILLPVVYIGLILAVAYGVYYHATNNLAMLDAMGDSNGRGGFMVLLAYVAPMIVGPVLVVFMIKPLFARGQKHERLRSLRRDREPLLFSFVDKICEAVGAPRPTRIDVDCQVNASASFRRGMLSMIGNDLVLTVGLPLVAGLNTRQLAGVLAHEFGHFSQGAGMRLSYLIRTISHWFHRVVYERDSWDQSLHRAASSIDLRISWVLWLAIIFVWITRRILGLLMRVGFLAGGYLLREMEFDADRYEARLAGSSTFESTARQLHILNAGMSRAQSQLQAGFREGRLVDDLPALAVQHAKRLPKEFLKQLDEFIAKQETSVWDTHPADKDRIANARAENTNGIFSVEYPASVLFSNFKEQSKGTTLSLYQAEFGEALKPGMLARVEDLAAESARQDAGDESLMRYTQRLFRPTRPLALNSNFLNRPDDPQANLERIKAARQRLVAAAPAARKTLAKIDEAQDQLTRAIQVQSFRRAGFKLKPKQVGKELATAEATKNFRDRAERELSVSGDRLAQVEAIIGERMLAALELLQLNRVASRIPGGEKVRDNVDRVLPALLGIQGQMNTLIALRDEFIALASLLDTLDGSDVSEKFASVVTGLAEQCAIHLAQVCDALSIVRYPFDHRERDIMLGGFLVPQMPSKQDVGAVYAAVGELLDRLANVQSRGVGELALAAQQVEQVLELPPLDEPPSEEPKDEPNETVQA